MVLPCTDITLPLTAEVGIGDSVQICNSTGAIRFSDTSGPTYFYIGWDIAETSCCDRGYARRARTVPGCFIQVPLCEFLVHYFGRLNSWRLFEKLIM
jgi:hypothetical protein